MTDLAAAGSTTSIAEPRPSSVAVTVALLCRWVSDPRHPLLLLRAQSRQAVQDTVLHYPTSLWRSQSLLHQRPLLCTHGRLPLAPRNRHWLWLPPRPLYVVTL